MKRRVASIIAIAIVVYAACGDPVPPTLYYEDFETLCEGTPCGWTRTRGEEDQATWIETIHEGDHGLRLVGEVTVHGPAGELDESAFPALLMHAAARCDPGSNLRVDVVVTDNVGLSHVASASPSADSEWAAELDVVFLEWVETAPTSVSGVSAVSITKTGSGACEISSIIVSDEQIQPGC